MTGQRPHLNITVESTPLEIDLKRVLQIIRPNWNDDKIQFKGTERVADAGLLNVMIICYIDEDMKDAVMCRIYREMKFNEYLTRQHEVKIIQIVHDRYGFAPNILATLNNGFCYEYIKGEVMITAAALKLEENWRLMAKQFALLHSTKPTDEMQHKCKLFELFDSWLATFPESLPKPEDNNKLKTCLPTKSVLLEEYAEVMKQVLSVGSETVFCHGDCRRENIVWDKDSGKITLVDWEVAGMGNQAYEMAYHFLRYGGLEPDFSDLPDKEFQLNWLRVYLETYLPIVRPNTAVTDVDVQKLYVQVQIHELLIILQCSCVVGSQSFDEIPLDLLSMSIAHYKLYVRMKDELLALQLPIE